MIRRFQTLLLLAALAVSACGSSGGNGGNSTKASAIAVFAPPDSGADTFLDVPFPNDLYLGANGTPDIVNPSDGTAPMDLVFQLVRTRHGFCRACSIAFPISGDLDPGTIPKDAKPDAVASLDDPIVLTRADGTGKPIPLEVDYDTVRSEIVIRPRYGIILDPATQYVAVLTDRIHAADGTSLGADTTFRQARDGGGGAAAKRSRAVVASALDALDKAGLPKKHIVSAAVFTTDDESFLLKAIKKEVAAATAPKLVVEHVYSAADGSLDNLLGHPSENRPGWDNPPADGVGTQSIVHDAIAFVILGTFETPRIVTGSGKDIGTLRQAADGSITPGPTPEQVPFALVVPKNANLAKLPVVFAHPGNPSTDVLALHVGNTFAKLGMATLSIDAFQMGRRAVSATDKLMDFRGTPGSDGFYEHSQASVELHIMALTDEPKGHEADLAYTLGFRAQVVSDAAMSVKLLHDGDASAIAAADPALAGFAFDPTQIYYLGQSFGAGMGMTALPIIPDVNAAILSMGPPDMVENGCNGPDNRSFMEFELTHLLALSRPFENSGGRLAMNPRVNLLDWALEPLTADNDLYYLLDHRLDSSPPPDLLWFYAMHDELLGQTSGEQVMGVANVPEHGPTYLAKLAPLVAPLSANRQTPNGTVTAGAWIYDSNHSLIRQKHIQIDYQTPFFPPFKKLAKPLDHDNPIEAAHKQMSAFFETRMKTGRATIIDPGAPN